VILNVRGFEKAENLKRDGHLARGEPSLWLVETLRSDKANVSYVTSCKLERGGFPKRKATAVRKQALERGKPRRVSGVEAA